MSRPSRVFVPHLPTSQDAVSGSIRPTFDLSPAEAFGSLQYILRRTHNPFDDPAATASEIERQLADHRFGATDWLLMIGSPILISITSALATQRVGVLRLLQWSRTEGGYLPVCVQLPSLAPLGERG